MSVCKKASRLQMSDYQWLEYLAWIDALRIWTKAKMVEQILILKQNQITDLKSLR